VSSDLVAAAVMKPVGGFVHLRKKTVNLQLVKYLAMGSVPAAFGGVLLIKALGDSKSVETWVQRGLGTALLLAAFGLAAKTYLNLASRARRYARGEFISKETNLTPQVEIKRLQTVLIGIVGGLVVGLTSVGSGSLMIVALLVLYPKLTASQLVGTDLVQAVPLVFSAALGHLLFGDVQLGVTLPLLLGAVPGAYLGARVSSTAPQGIIRRALAIVLSISALKLFGVPTDVLAYSIIGIFIAGPSLWMLIRVREGLPPLGRTEGRIVEHRISSGSVEPLGRTTRSANGASPLAAHVEDPEREDLGTPGR
jgi:uncharacterized membrane protein YfcA